MSTIPPDASVSSQKRRRGAETVERETSLIDDLQELKEVPMGRQLLWLPVSVASQSITTEDKKALEAHDAELTTRAGSRAEKCWSYMCSSNAVIWVREVQFSLKDGVDHSVVSSDYSGPVPGFCKLHERYGGPEQLAEKVYFDQTPMAWGFKPKWWYVIFTDGTKIGGGCVVIDPKQEQPKIIEEYVSSDN